MSDPASKWSSHQDGPLKKRWPQPGTSRPPGMTAVMPPRVKIEPDVGPSPRHATSEVADNSASSTPGLSGHGHLHSFQVSPIKKRWLRQNQFYLEQKQQQKQQEQEQQQKHPQQRQQHQQLPHPQPQHQQHQQQQNQQQQQQLKHKKKLHHGQQKQQEQPQQQQQQQQQHNPHHHHHQQQQERQQVQHLQTQRHHQLVLPQQQHQQQSRTPRARVAKLELDASASAGESPRFWISQAETPQRSLTWDEDLNARLRELVEEEGVGDWHDKAESLGLGRTKGRHVRNHWMHYVNPRADRSPLSEAEVRTVMRAVKSSEFISKRGGIRWSSIAALLAQRTDNCLKNQYNAVRIRNGWEQSYAQWVAELSSSCMPLPSVSQLSWEAIFPPPPGACQPLPHSPSPGSTSLLTPTTRHLCLPLRLHLGSHRSPPARWQPLIG